MLAKFPELRTGTWKISFANYVFFAPDSDPILVADFGIFINVLKNKDKTTDFYFADSTITSPGIIDGILNWKNYGNNRICEAYLILNNPLVSGWAEISIKKKDKKKRVTGFIGNLIQGGPKFPSCGYINLNWISDKETSEKNINNKVFDLLKKERNM